METASVEEHKKQEYPTHLLKPVLSFKMITADPILTGMEMGDNKHQSLYLSKVLRHLGLETILHIFQNLVIFSKVWRPKFGMIVHLD